MGGQPRKRPSLNQLVSLMCQRSSDGVLYVERGYPNYDRPRFPTPLHPYIGLGEKQLFSAT